MYPIEIAISINGVGGNSGATFFIISEGDGTGVNGITMKVSSDITVRLSGNARFYTNSGGTLGESTEWTVLAGADRDIFIKCTSGTSTMTFEDASKVLTFNYGTTPIPDDVPSLSGNISAFPNSTNIAIATRGVMSGGADNLNDSIQLYIVNDGCTVGGNITGMTGMTFLELRGELGAECSSTTTGDISDWRDLYNYWLISQFSEMTGDMTDVGADASAPDFFTHFVDISPLSSYSGTPGVTTLVQLALAGSLHTISLDITDFPAMNRCELPSCNIDTYTPGKVFAFDSYDWIINPNAGYGLVSTSIDTLIGDAAASNLTNAPNIFELKGYNAPRSIASDADVATLEGEGTEVNTWLYPVIATITVEDAEPDYVVFTFNIDSNPAVNEELDPTSVPVHGDFTISGKTTTGTVIINGFEAKVQVTVPFIYGETSNATYTPGTNKIRGSVYELQCNAIGSTAINNNVQPSGGITPQAFLDAAGITDNTIEQAIIDYFADRDAIDPLTNAVACYPVVGGTDFTHKWNAYDPVDSDAAKRLAFAGTITHDANGMQGNGTDGRGNTFIVPDDEFVEDFCCFFYTRSTGINAGGIDFGAIAGGNNPGLLCAVRPNTEVIISANSDIEVRGNTIANGRGFILVKRVNDTVTIKLNDVTKDSFTAPNTVLSPYQMKVMASDISGSSVIGYCNKQYTHFEFLTTGTTDQQDTDLYNAVLAKETALGRN